MKIQPENAAGASGIGTSRTHETGAPALVQKEGRKGPAGLGEDRAEISSLTARISESISASEIGVSERVAAVAALYSKGHYDADAASLSRAMVSHALGNVDGE